MKKLDTHTFTLNKNANGGEQVFIITTYYDNGDGIPDGIYTQHEICLNSYGNTASIYLGCQITPELLRQLANELDVARNNLVTE